MKNLQIVEKRKTYFMISISIMAVLLIISIFNVVNGKSMFNYDVEFSGGTTVSADLVQDFESEDITKIIEDTTGLTSSSVQQSVGSNEVYIKMHEIPQESIVKLTDALVKEYGISKSDIQINSVSSTVSSEMKTSAMLAVITAVAAILVYIALRFRNLNTALSAVSALVHDSIIVVLFYSAFQFPINNAFIAVMLTIIGYSINATIVIFDRARENQKLHPTMELEELVDSSVLQTVNRSIYTSLTTMLPLITLYLFGVTSIQEFSLPIIIGVVAGTYSSVFISANIWYTLTKKGLFTKKDEEVNTPKRFKTKA